MLSHLDLLPLLQHVTKDKTMEQRLVDSVMSHVAGTAARKGHATLNQFLRDPKYSGLSTTYTAAIDRSNRCVIDLVKLADLIRMLNIPLEALFSVDWDPPYDDWMSGAVVAFILGQRFAQIPEVASGVKQQVLGSRDVKATMEATNRLREELELRFATELHLLPAGATLNEADALVNSLIDRPDVQMVIAIGSPVVNLASESIARIIVGSPHVEPLPARFRFSCDPSDLGFPPGYDPLLIGPPCAHDAEGIDYTRGVVPRMRDDEVKQRLLHGNMGPFPDCGLLLFDYARYPMLAAACGHGGNGTIAAARALGEADHLAESFLNAQQPGAPLGPGRILEVVRVDRYKPRSGAPARPNVDDLDFDRSVDWQFV